MTQKELKILTHAVAIAKRNGLQIKDDFFTELSVEDNLLKNQPHYYSIIFTHDFAKHFWGEDLLEIENQKNEEEEPREVDLVRTAETNNFPIAGLAASNSTIRIPMWQYHLGQMVFRQNPIQYIAETLEESF